MAKVVKLPKNKEFNFKQTSGGGSSKYPWSEWLNGDLLLLEQSEGDKDEAGTVVTVKTKKDFEVSAEAMRGKTKTAARKLYKVADISFRDADGKKLVDSLIIRGRDMTAEERQAEDILRAEERDAAKTLREAINAEAKRLGKTFKAMTKDDIKRVKDGMKAAANGQQATPSPAPTA